MTHLKPTNEMVTDSITGQFMPMQGVQRPFLTPADHKQITRGELVIQESKTPVVATTPEAAKKGGK